MKPIKKVAAGLLLAFGFVCVMVTISELFDRDVTPEEKQNAMDTAIGGLAFGIPTLAAGGWLGAELYRDKQKKKLELDKEESDRLQGIFFQMLRERNGQITVLHFSMESQLSANHAKLYLDEKAKEFNADFEVSDRGDVVYHFQI